MAHVKLGFDERYARDEMLQEVFLVNVVDFDLFVGEGLLGW